MRACPMSDIEFTKLVVGFHVTSVHSIALAAMAACPQGRESESRTVIRFTLTAPRVA